MAALESRIHGEFLDRQGRTVTVIIALRGSAMPDIEIGGSAVSYGGQNDVRIMWTDDPVDITCETNDTFDVMLRHSCTIRLGTTAFLPDLFRTSWDQSAVNILRDGQLLFAGYIEPQTYSQPYNEREDDLELNCVDALSALQYNKYLNAGQLGTLWSVLKAEARQRTFHDIITAMLDGVTADIDLTGSHPRHYWTDASKAVNADSANRTTVMRQMSVDDLLFLGETEDDCWQQEEVMDTLLMYLNLHIVQNGLDFHIFDWATVKDGIAPITWYNLEQTAETMTTSRRQVVITSAIVDGTDTQISVGEVYNQLQLTAKVEAVENVVESPLDDDLLTSVFNNRQKYMTEITAWGSGESAKNAFFAMTHNRATDYDGAETTDWYIQVMSNKAWTFRNGIDPTAATQQQALPNWLSANPGAAIIAMGKNTTQTKQGDNSVVSKISMDNCLIISVNGNDSESAIRAAMPYAEYQGNVSGGVFSPADSGTTNYIVISGKLALVPLLNMSKDYLWLSRNNDWQWGGSQEEQVRPVNGPDEDNKRYYTQRYYTAARPSDTETADNSRTAGLQPLVDKAPQSLEYVDEGNHDTVSKVPVLRCMLIIGNKCVVETGRSGRPSDYSWRTYRERSECSSDQDYYSQSFSIGFDPKLGDKLIGTEFDMQNNIDYHLGLDTEGIAIPITMSDRVSGQVQFKILGPYNAVWKNGWWTSASFWNHSNFGYEYVPVLKSVASILVKRFEVKVYSDNALVNNTGDNDIVYLSDMRPAFVNPKDDLEFSVCSALTTEERQQLGVGETVSLSTPRNETTGVGVTTVYDATQRVTDKPERLYIDAYYREYSVPRVIMEQKLQDIEAAHVSPWNHFLHPALNKDMYVTAVSRNLVEGRADLTLKEA